MFHDDVLNIVNQIPRGSVTTYGIFGSVKFIVSSDNTLHCRAVFRFLK